jgi:hypothetical protein
MVSASGTRPSSERRGGGGVDAPRGDAGATRRRARLGARGANDGVSLGHEAVRRAEEGRTSMRRVAIWARRAGTRARGVASKP